MVQKRNDLSIVSCLRSPCDGLFALRNNAAFDKNAKMESKVVSFKHVILAHYRALTEISFIRHLPHISLSHFWESNKRTSIIRSTCIKTIVRNYFEGEQLQTFVMQFFTKWALCISYHPSITDNHKQHWLYGALCYRFLWSCIAKNSNEVMNSWKICA